MYLILLTLSPFVTSVHDIKSTAGAPQANWSHMMLWGQPNIPEAARSWQAEQPNRTIKCFLKREGNRKMRWRKGLWGGEIIDCLNKFVTSIKVFLLMKHCMFLFSFSSVLMERSYWSICGMWSIGKINLDRREAQMFSMFDFFKKKKLSWSPPFATGHSTMGHVLNFLLHHLCSVWIRGCCWTRGRKSRLAWDLSYY